MVGYFTDPLPTHDGGDPDRPLLRVTDLRNTVAPHAAPLDWRGND